MNSQESSPAKMLFLGILPSEQFYSFPSFKTGEQETLSLVIDSIERFLGSKQGNFREFDQKGEQPQNFLEQLKQLGLFGIIIPEEYGGLDLSSKGYARVLQQISQHDGSTGLTIGAHSSIGMKGIILFGNKQQKERYLPRLATGELIAAFCLTEPGSGSDAASIRTNAQKNADGSWLLSGEKIWITNGAFAELFTVFARTEGEKGKITAFIVERGFGGVESGPKEDKMGIRASATTSIHFTDVRVPAENLLGEEGKGFKVAMSILNNGRTGLGGGCVGGMKRCIELGTKQATERKQFGRSIAEFGLIKEKIAQMTINCFVTESLVSMVAHYIDSGVEDYSVEAAVSKVFASEAMWQAANESLQIAAGNGFMRDFPYERMVRDSRINLIFEGTNEILRLYIALSGMKDAGEYLKEIGKGAGNIFNDPIKGFGVLSGYVTKRISRMTALGRDRMEMVHPSLADDAYVYEQSAQRLAKATDEVLRHYGKNIIGEQFVSKRIADVAIDLFAGLCTLSRVSTMIQHSSPEACEQERRILHIFTQQERRRINSNLQRLISNEDEDLKALSDHMVNSGKYLWDTF